MHASIFYDCNYAICEFMYRNCVTLNPCLTLFSALTYRWKYNIFQYLNLLRHYNDMHRPYLFSLAGLCLIIRAMFFVYYQNNTFVYYQNNVFVHYQNNVFCLLSEQCFCLLSEQCFCPLSEQCFCLLSEQCFCLLSEQCFCLLSEQCFCLLSEQCFCLLSEQCFCLLSEQCFCLLSADVAAFNELQCNAESNAKQLKKST